MLETLHNIDKTILSVSNAVDVLTGAVHEFKEELKDLKREVKEIREWRIRKDTQETQETGGEKKSEPSTKELIKIMISNWAFWAFLSAATVVSGSVSGVFSELWKLFGK